MAEEDDCVVSPQTKGNNSARQTRDATTKTWVAYDCVVVSSVDSEVALQSQSWRTESNTALALELRCCCCDRCCSMTLSTPQAK